MSTYITKQTKNEYWSKKKNSTESYVNSNDRRKCSILDGVNFIVSGWKNLEKIKVKKKIRSVNIEC